MPAAAWPSRSEGHLEHRCSRLLPTLARLRNRRMTYFDSDAADKAVGGMDVFSFTDTASKCLVGWF